MPRARLQQPQRHDIDTHRPRPRTGWVWLRLWAAGWAILALGSFAFGVDWLVMASRTVPARERPGAYAVAILLLAVGAYVFVSGVRRFLRVRRAARDLVGRTFNSPDIRGRRVRVKGGAGSPDLEWKVMAAGLPPVRSMSILGSPEPGNWLVVRLLDNRLIWPATRAQPVIGTGMPSVPRAADADLDVEQAHRRLLGAYVRIMSQAHALPFLVRVPPTRWESYWWWIGAPRPVIESFATAHIRSRLRALGDSHTQAAVLTELPDGDALRRTLRAAAQECQELAGTLRRPAWPALLASLVGFCVPLYVALFPPPIPWRRPGIAVSLAISLALFAVAAVPLVIFFRSMLCKRALFGTVISDRPLQGTDPADWDVYRFEREAFLRAGASEPVEWEGSPWVPWLVEGGYAFGVAIPFLISNNPILHGFLTDSTVIGLYIGLLTFACSRVFFSILGYGIRDSAAALRRVRDRTHGASSDAVAE